MDAKILTTMLSFVFSAVIGYITPDVQASSSLGKGRNSERLGAAVLHDQAARDLFNKINQTYFGNAGRIDESLSHAKLPGYRKRHGVFKLQKGKEDGTKEDLTFDSKKDAKDFCDLLIQLATFSITWKDVHNQPPLTDTTIYTDSPSYRVISVAYSIAYDEGSTRAADGTSTPAQKHVFCKNPWEWEPNARWKDEDESTGVLLSSLRGNGYPGGYYDVTCVDSERNPPTTFWFTEEGDFVIATNNVHRSYRVAVKNLTSLHDYNQFIGAQYCSGN
jgi:hypothetical protein